MAKDITNKKRLKFDFYPADEEAFIETEANLRKYIEHNKHVPSELVKQFLDLLYSKEQRDNEFMDAYRELGILYLTAIETTVKEYLRELPLYWFRITEDGKEYSTEDWLKKLFDELRAGKRIDTRRRTAFIVFIAGDLISYIREVKVHISKYGISVITGYICAMFGHVIHPKKFNPAEYSYANYHSYLSSTIGGILDNNLPGFLTAKKR